MNKLLNLIILTALSLGFSSCYSMFGDHTTAAGYRTETKQVRTCGYQTITEENFVSDGAKGGFMQTTEKRVPRYKTVTKKVKIPCPECVRFYRPKKSCCGSNSDKLLRMTTAQGPVGSPHIGLVPTMKKLVE